MNKYLLFIVLGSILLTGCGGKTLTCTSSKQEDGISMNEKIVLSFDKDGKAIKKGTFSAEFEVSDEFSEYLNELVDEVDNSFNDLKDAGINYELSEKDNKITIKINYNVKDMSEDQLDELYFSSMYFEDDYDTIKSDYEDLEYTCK